LLLKWRGQFASVEVVLELGGASVGACVPVVQAKGLAYSVHQ